MTCTGSAKGEHEYRKFDDTSLFCKHCGDRKVIAPPAITWHPYWTHPWYPSVTPPYIVWNTSSTYSVTSGALTESSSDD